MSYDKTENSFKVKNVDKQIRNRGKTNLQEWKVYMNKKYLTGYLIYSLL